MARPSVPKETQIEKMKNIHGDLYDYSQAEFTKTRDSIWIYCNEHQLWFQQRVDSHLSGVTSCSYCRNEKRIEKLNKKTKENIQQRLRTLMDLDESFESPLENFLDYHQFKCKHHGVFKIKPANVINNDSYCPICMEEDRLYKLTKNISTNAYNNSNGNVYVPLCQRTNDYRDKLKNFCYKHGQWSETMAQELRKGKTSCSECCRENMVNAKPKIKITDSEYIEAFREVHGDFYDYSKFNRKEDGSGCIIICPIHGEFEQSPYSHVRGGGCLKCARQGGYNEKYFDSEIKKESPGYLYVLQIETDDHRFLKVGIAKNSKNRKKSIKSGLKEYSVNNKISTLRDVKLPMYESYTIEQSVLNTFYTDSFFNKYRFPGWTECICIGKKDEVLDFVDQELLKRGL